MKYDAAQVDHIAAEYVLGTLQSSARLRFENLIAERADVRFAVWRWERHLNVIASGLAPQTPPRRIWKNIRRRIEPANPAVVSAIRRWRAFWLAIPTAAAAAWLAVALLPVPGPERVAVFSDQNAAALWVVSADLDKRLLQTESMREHVTADDTSFELWVLPAEGPPMSLGVLPISTSTVEVSISAQLASMLENESSLAISIEPAGGSPTGLPTGPVVYQATLVSI